MSVREETDLVTLHAREITVHSVSFVYNDGRVAPPAIETRYNSKSHTVAFLFDGKLTVGEGKLVLHFQGILNSDMAGFYKSSYVDAHGEKKVMASTQFEALDARRAFPCWDEPAVKATFQVTLIVDAHLTALSNMPAVSVIHQTAAQQQGGKCAKRRLKKVVFDVSPKMSTYLLAWAVGEFDVVQGRTKGGVQLAVFTPPGRGAEGEFALDVGIRSLDFFDDFFGTPYPLPKMDMLCVTEFAMGAMENWGLVTYRENALMIDPAKASPQAKQRVAIVVAHELAHQWFGNLVTMAWWDGLWLNEGFAAFMEHFCIDALFPEYHIWDQFTTDAFASAQRLDALRSSHPVIVPIVHAEEVEQVFDAISYCKGSTVVNMVYTLLGPAAFRDGLRQYMRKHAYGNTETIDLWQAWQQVSGLDVPKLMESWTTATGYPFLSVLREDWSKEGEVTFTLEQKRFFSDGSEGEEEQTIWAIPIVFATSSASTEAVTMTERIQTFTIRLSSQGGKGWVKINAGQKALVRVAHTEEMTRRLVLAIGRGEINAVDRAALLLDAYALTKAGYASAEIVVQILRALEGETSSIVWGAISGVLQGFFLLFEQKEENKGVLEAFQSFVQTRLLLPALQRVGWDGHADEGHSDKLTRATVLSLAETFAPHHPAIVAEARKRFHEHWTNSSAIASEIKTSLYRLALLNGDQHDFQRLLDHFHSTEDNQERKYVYFSIGYVPDAGLKQKALDWALEEVKLQDFFYPIGSVAFDLKGCALAWKYYVDHFDSFKQKLAKASPSLMDAVIVNVTNRFVSEERAAEIETFFAAHPLPQSSRRIAQCLENMRANAKMLRSLEGSPVLQISYWA